MHACYCLGGLCRFEQYMLAHTFSMLWRLDDSCRMSFLSHCEPLSVCLPSFLSFFSFDSLLTGLVRQQQTPGTSLSPLRYTKSASPCHHIHFFIWYPRVELRSLYLHSKCLTEPSPQLLLSGFYVFILFSLSLHLTM